jgi:hypothetical protein
MESLLSLQFSWTNFFTSALFLLVLFFALQFIDRLLKRTSFLSIWHSPVKKAVRYLLLLFEPIALSFLGGIFVLINPIFHGLLLVFLFLTAFTHLRNYIAGRVIQLDHQIDRGSQIRSGDIEGVVLEMGRLGVQIQTKEGLYRLTYVNLLRQGYTLISGEEIGGFYQLRIHPKDETSKIRHLQFLQNNFVTVPYLDRNHKPELIALDEQANKLEARVLVREENHLYDLIALIKEWGYHCVVSEH